MRSVFFSLLLALALSTPCQAQGVLQGLSQQYFQNQGQAAPPTQVQLPGSPAGSTSLPPGNYVMTNMESGQGIIITVINGGQMIAIDPRTVQVMLQPYQQQQQQMPAMQQQQAPGNGIGSMIKGTLNNYLEKKLAPQPVQQY